jgi:hypothetical protein
MLLKRCVKPMRRIIVDTHGHMTHTWSCPPATAAWQTVAPSLSLCRASSSEGSADSVDLTCQ